jgi:CHASE2 domain-containing sensor protein/predicted Ser/Thr protein kinase
VIGRLRMAPDHGRRRRPRGVAVLLPALCGVVVAVGLGATGGLDRLELASIDTRFDLRGTQPPPEDVVIVALDERSLERFGRPPIPRTVHARLLDRLRAARPKVIAYDFQFVHRRPREDPALRTAVGLARPVVLATTRVYADGETPVLGSTATVEALGGRVGTALFPLLPGVEYVRVTGSAIGLPTFAAVAAQLAGAKPPPGELDGAGALVDYAGPPGTLRPLSFVDVLDGKVAAAKLRGKVVVVGATYATSSDFHATPTTGAILMTGVEIQANSIATILAGVPLRDASGWLDGLILLALCLAAAYLGRRLNPLAAVAASALGLLVGAVLAQLAFDAGTVLAIVSPVTGVGVSVISAAGLEQRSGRRERARLVELVERLAPGQDPAEVIERLAGRGDGAVLVEGTHFGVYLVGELLGLGGMGVVYAAHNEALDRAVAIKVLAPGIGEDAVVRERLRREALSAARLEHPNVVAVYDAGTQSGRAFIAMQRVEGRALHDLVGTPWLTTARIADIVGMVAAALDHAHERGVVHRDVKPQNILVEDDGGRALLADFGIAAAAGQDRLTSVGDVVGTVAYAAPEQLAGDAPDRGVDVYALGCVVFELLTGHLPFERTTLAAAIQAHLTLPPPDVSAWRPDLAGSGVDAAVSRALAKDPAERWPSAGAMADAVRAALRDERAPCRSRPSGSDPDHPTRPA